MAARLASANDAEAVRAIFEDARDGNFDVAPVANIEVSPAPLSEVSQGDPLRALAQALTEQLAAMQQQELRALKAEVSAALR